MPIDDDHMVHNAVYVLWSWVELPYQNWNLIALGIWYRVGIAFIGMEYNFFRDLVQESELPLPEWNLISLEIWYRSRNCLYRNGIEKMELTPALVEISNDTGYNNV